MFCMHCGKKIDDKAEFCGYCGGKVIVVQPEEPIQRSTSESVQTNIPKPEIVKKQTPDVVYLSTDAVNASESVPVKPMARQSEGKTGNGKIIAAVICAVVVLASAAAGLFILRPWETPIPADTPPEEISQSPTPTATASPSPETTPSPDTTPSPETTPSPTPTATPSETEVDITATDFNESAMEMLNLVGMHWVEARNQLLNVQFDLSIEYRQVEDSTRVDGEVVRTVPGYGETISPGDAVIIEYVMQEPDSIAAPIPELEPLSLEEMILTLDDSYIVREDLLPYTLEELGYLRNGIYALSGYIFSRDIYSQYFNAQSWYYGNTDSQSVASSRFNEYQKSNLAVIRAYEGELGG